MFAERFNALMNIAEVSNSLLGRGVHLSPSYIGRLRSGTRPLPKNQEYLGSICTYLANHINKSYQVNALRNLMAIDITETDDTKSIAASIEQWLMANDSANDTSLAGSVVMRQDSASSCPTPATTSDLHYLYGNKGKRKAVDEFFQKVLQEEKPQTLLLFSDENMSWLYEDDRFAMLWAESFKKVIMKGNRVRIIHTISRDINEMMEAISKWLPIYATGMVEPYFYPRLRDGILHRTLFIAPKTAAIVSSSIQHDTSGMLNLFITDPSAIKALHLEYERYFSLCQPLMKVYTERDRGTFSDAFHEIESMDGDAIICCKSADLFCDSSVDFADIFPVENDSDGSLGNVPLIVSEKIPDDLVLYIKDGVAIKMIKRTDPKAAFQISSPNLVSAAWDYFIDIK